MTLGRTLAIGVCKGLWTLKDLDGHSPSSHELEADRRRSEAPQPASAALRGHTRPVMRYPHAGQYLPPRNLAREWIEANPEEWNALCDRFRSQTALA